MNPTINDLGPGTVVYVSWADSVETHRVSRVRVQDVHDTNNGWRIADACNRTQMIRLAQSPSDPCLLVDQPDDDIENGRVNDVSVHPIFAIAYDTKDLLWRTQRNIIERGYEPADGMDLAAVHSEIISTGSYASLQKSSEQDLHEHVNEIVAELIETAQCTAESLDLDTIQPDWTTGDSKYNGDSQTS